MYNGVGLPTPRGSGSSGHVQRNCAAVYKKVNYEEENISDTLNRPLNKEILEHTRKREIEIKCLELSDTLEEQGYTDEEMEIKVQAYRKLLLDEYNKSQKIIQHLDEYTQPILQEFHQSTENQLERKAKLQDVFDVSSDDQNNLESKSYTIASTEIKS